MPYVPAVKRHWVLCPPSHSTRYRSTKFTDRVNFLLHSDEPVDTRSKRLLGADDDSDNDYLKYSDSVTVQAIGLRLLPWYVPPFSRVVLRSVSRPTPLLSPPNPLPLQSLQPRQQPPRLCGKAGKKWQLEDTYRFDVAGDHLWDSVSLHGRVRDHW